MAKKAINSGTVKILKQDKLFDSNLEHIKNETGIAADTEAIRVAVKFYADFLRSQK